MQRAGMKALYEREKAIRPPDVLREGGQLRQSELDALFFDQGGLRSDLVRNRSACPVCGEATLQERPRSSDRPTTKNWPMALCRTCGGLTLMALPTRQAMTEYYATSRAEAMFQQRFYEGTKQKRLASVDEPRVRWIRELASAPLERRLLDVGCSTGAFAETMQQTGEWSCKGIDANPEAVRIARDKGLDVELAQLEEYTPTSRFDAITFFSVLAQLDDPLGSLRRLRANLVPGGHLFLAEVNFDGFYAAVVGEDHASYLPPLHKNYLTARTLVTLLKRAGFEDIRVQTPGALDLVRVWMYWEQGGMNGRNEALYRIIEHEFETDSPALQEIIVSSKASEHIWVSARLGDSSRG